MNFRTTYGLFAAFLAMLLIAGIWLFTGPKPGEESLLLPSAKSAKLEAKDFDRVVIDRKYPREEKLVFQRVDKERWRQTQPSTARVNGRSVENIINDLLAARAEGKEGVNKSLDEIGLRPPAVTVTLGRADGDSLSASFGNVTAGSSPLVFAISSDRPERPITLRRSTVASLFKSDNAKAHSTGELCVSTADLRPRGLLFEEVGEANAKDTLAITLTNEKDEVALVQDELGWKFVKPANFGRAQALGAGLRPGGAENEVAGVDALVAALAAIKPIGDDVVTNPTDLAQFGLDPGREAGPKCEVARKAGDGRVTEKLLIGKTEEGTGKVFVRLEGDTTIAKVPGSLIEPITRVLKRPKQLRDKTLLSIPPARCDAIDIKLPDEANTLELRLTGEPAVWRLYDAAGDSRLANRRTIDSLLAALAGKAVDFPDSGATDAALGFDKPSAEITLYVGGIIPPDKKGDAKSTAKGDGKDKANVNTSDPTGEKPPKPNLKEPNARLVFGKRHNDLYYVRRIAKDETGKDHQVDFAVPDSLHELVTRRRMDYLDPNVPKFQIADATKLQFWRDGESFAVEKVNDQWVIRLPADRADRRADSAKINAGLSRLANLNVVKLATDAPKPGDLDRYGLTNPKFKATVTTQSGGKVIERTFSFGNEIPEPSQRTVNRYARHSERNDVFVVANLETQDLESGEIQDPLAVQIDPPKITAIKLTGWGDVVVKTESHELQRKSSTEWTLKGDDKVKVDAAVCEKLLNALAVVHAQSFVVHKSGPKPEHKLDVAKGGLEIAIQVEGQKDPVILMLGGLDAADGNSYYASTSQLPGDVFLVKKNAFDWVRAKPAFFVAK